MTTTLEISVPKPVLMPAVAASDVLQRLRSFPVMLAGGCLVASGLGAAIVISADRYFEIAAPDLVARPHLAVRPVAPIPNVIGIGEMLKPVARNRQSLYLVRSTLLALNQANVTGNYSVLRALGTPDFRAKNSSADLAMIFSGLRRNNIDLAEVALIEPKWRNPKSVKGKGRKLRGVIAMRARDVFFDMQFKPVAGNWRIFALSVSAQPSAKAGQDGKGRRRRGGDGTARFPAAATPAAHDARVAPQSQTPAQG